MKQQQLTKLQQSIERMKKHADVLRSSPLFNLSLSDKELFHSNLWRWLANTQRCFFYEVFSELCGERIPYKEKEFEVVREDNNFDLSIKLGAEFA